MQLKWAFVPLVLALGGCAMARAQVAQDARNKMIGMTKEQVLACMGPPVQNSAVGQTEVWTYLSGNGATNAVASRYANVASISTSQRSCTVNVVMADGRVGRVNYSGPTGGLLSEGEQCAFVVRDCLR